MVAIDKAGHQSASRISSRPLVSVILPTRNRADLLEGAIRSVLDQSYSELELIVVDDASEDRTSEVVAGFDFANLRLIRHPRQLGAAAARNSGVKASRGELLAFQDSDDRWLPGKLELQVGLLVEAPAAVSVVYGGFVRVRAGVRTTFPPRIVRWAHHLRLPGHALDGDLRRSLPRGNVVTTQAALVTRNCVEQVGGFDPDLVRFDDWDLWLRIAQRWRYIYIDQPVVEVRLEDDSLSTDVDAAVRDLERMAAKHPLSKRPLLAASSFIRGDQALEYGEMEDARRHLLRAVRLAPGNGWYWLAFAASLAGRRASNAVARLTGLGYRRG